MLAQDPALKAMLTPYAAAVAAKLKDKDDEVRRAAAETLGKIAPEMLAHTPALRAMLKDNDDEA
eukprot:5162538-Prymnesium_polylepis.1